MAGVAFRAALAQAAGGGAFTLVAELVILLGVDVDVGERRRILSGRGSDVLQVFASFKLSSWNRSEHTGVTISALRKKRGGVDFTLDYISEFVQFWLLLCFSIIIFFFELILIVLLHFINLFTPQISL